MKVKTYGLKMVGLAEASENTRYHGNNCYTQISYDPSDGEVLTNYHCSIGRNNWTQYHDPDIMTICFTNRHMGAQRIANKIAEAVNRNKMAVDATNTDSQSDNQ